MRTLPRSYYAQAVVMYAVVGLTPVLTYLVGGTNSPITDAAGMVWQTRSIAEAAATVSIYTMIFAAGLSAAKLAQGLAGAQDSSVEPAVGTDALIEKETSSALTANPRST
jgi:hypothetical protein